MRPCVADDLGRAREKFEQELPKCTLGLEDLTEFLSHMHGSFDPYSKHFAAEREPKRSAPVRSWWPDIGYRNRFFAVQGQ